MIEQVGSFRRVSNEAEYEILYHNDKLPGDAFLELRITQMVCNLLLRRMEREGLQLTCQELLEQCGAALLEGLGSERLEFHGEQLPRVYVNEVDCAALISYIKGTL